MDEDGGPKTPVVPLHDLIDELSPFVAESTRQAFAEKLASLGAVPRATVETTSMHSTAMVISAGMASNTEISSEKFFKPDPISPVAPLSTIRPSLKDLVRHAVPRIAPAWYDVGLQLDLEPDVLDEIEKEKSDQPRKMLAKWLQGSSCTWQSVLNAVEIIRGGKPMEDIRAAVVESITGAQSTELSRKRRRSSTRSSDDIVLLSVAKKSLPDYTSIKMDLLARDMSDLHSESDPEVIIKLLYGNALATISDLLEPHLKTVKKEAGRYHRLGVHHVAVGEDIIESADSIDSLMSRMSVGGMWDQTRFLRRAIASVPHSAPERGIAEAVLSHYHLHLAIYERTTLLKDALAKKSESEEEVEASTEEKKLVPLKITSPKAFESFSCEDCHILQVQVLKKAYGIPDEKIICREVEDGHSTTVTFMIARQYVHDVIQHSGQLDTVWILLELDIIEVSIPGVFTFIPSVGCFLSLLRGSKPFTADLLGVTEVLPYQMYCLLDSDIREPFSGCPLSVKRIEQRWDSHDEFPLSDAQSEDDATQAMLFVEPGQVTGGPTAVEELARIREEASKGSSGETGMAVDTVPPPSDVAIADMTSDEVLLQQLCYMATGIKQLLISPAGGTFTLGNGDASLEFPPGAVEKNINVRYAIILHGPFVFHADFKPGSVVVYINMDGATLVKPVQLFLSHWCIRVEADDEAIMKFVRAPHSLESGKVYAFEEVEEEADFKTHSDMGVLTIKEPHCLYCVEAKGAKNARYCAMTFTCYIPSEKTLLFRIQLLCDSSEWIKKLPKTLGQEGWQKSTSKTVPRFSFSAECITASTTVSQGPGWNAVIEGTCKMKEADFLMLKGKSKAAIDQEVIIGLFPPHVCYKILYGIPEERRVMPAFLKVDLHGADVPLTFSCRFNEAETSYGPSRQFPSASMSLSSPQAEISNPADVLVALNHALDVKWRQFGTYLCIKPVILDSIDADRFNVGERMLQLIEKWLGHDNGTGDLPRTWETVVQAVKKTGPGYLAEQMAQRYGVQLSGQ